jgi:S1-C subfamily serine protease
MRLRAALALLASAIALAACGSDDPETVTVNGTETGEAAAGDAKRVVIEAQQGAFDAQTIYENAAPGVVTVTSIFGGGGTPDLFGGGGGSGQGSGFVISDDGEIVTNAHVITDAATTGEQVEPLDEAREVYVQFDDRNQVEAEIVGFDPYADVGLLKVDPEGLDLHPLPLGSEGDVEVGEGVAAIGSPVGELQSQSL